MVLMLVLCVFVALGIVAIWRWSHLEVEPPWKDDPTWPLSPAEAMRRYLWYVTIGLTASLASGIVMIGIGGRLAMRLLAITAGDAAQGRITEADQVVGEITFDGTIGFILFFGLVSGFLLGMVYMLIRRWLPRGRWGGVAYASLLLIFFATRSDPLRPDNPDFDIVGPGWVAVLVFVLFGWGFGMLMGALAGRYSRALPPLAKEWRVLIRYAPLLLLILFWFFLIPIGIGAAIALLVTRIEGIPEFLRSSRTILVGRALGLVAAAVTAPGFFIGVFDIATGA